MMSDGKVFISYRRGIDSDSAGRLHDRLESKLGRHRLFYDVDSIPPGVDFHEFLNDQVDQCAAFLSVIGQGWLAEAERLHKKNDFVRIELEAALARERILVIPVLMQGVEMPTRGILPESLHRLTRRNAVKVPYDHFAQVVDGKIAQALIGLKRDGTTPAPAYTAPIASAFSNGNSVMENLKDQNTGVPEVQEQRPTQSDARSFRQIAQLQLKASLVLSVAFSPDGTLLAAGCSNGTIQIWDPENRRHIRTLRGHAE
ncbi:MAG: TIR domain-containing protein, partial [Pseudomonadota bacterium]